MLMCFVFTLFILIFICQSPQKFIKVQHIDDECAICLVNLEKAVRLPCSHIFHDACVDEWLKYSTDCPICKRNMYCKKIN